MQLSSTSATVFSIFDSRDGNSQHQANDVKRAVDRIRLIDPRVVSRKEALRKMESAENAVNEEHEFCRNLIKEKKTNKTKNAGGKAARVNRF